MGLVGKKSPGSLGVMDEGGKWVRTTGWWARGHVFLTTHASCLFTCLSSSCQQWDSALRPSRTSGPPQSSLNPTRPAINHQAVCVIAINILFPAEVLVHDLSSRLFFIRVCWAAPAVEGARFVWLASPPQQLLRKMTQRWEVKVPQCGEMGLKAGGWAPASLPERTPPTCSRPQPGVINQRAPRPDG